MPEQFGTRFRDNQALHDAAKAYTKKDMWNDVLEQYSLYLDEYNHIDGTTHSIVIKYFGNNKTLEEFASWSLCELWLSGFLSGAQLRRNSK